MAVIEIGITLDEAQKSVLPVPPGRYKATLVDWHKDDSGQILVSTQKGKKMVKPVFKIQHEDPSYTGRQFIFNAVLGSFSFGELSVAIPQLIVSRGLDTEAGKGVDVWIDLSIGTYEGRERNQIDHVHHIAAQ